MPGNKYRLSYLPLFYEELDEKLMYISEKLQNPLKHTILFGKENIHIIVYTSEITSSIMW